MPEEGGRASFWQISEPYSNQGGRLCPPHYFQPPRFLDGAASLLPLLNFYLIVSRIQCFCTNRQLMRFYDKNINEDLKIKYFCRPFSNLPHVSRNKVLNSWLSQKYAIFLHKAAFNNIYCIDIFLQRRLECGFENRVSLGFTSADSWESMTLWAWEDRASERPSAILEPT